VYDVTANKPKKYPMLSFRVSFEEKARAKALAKSLKKRYPYLSLSDVYRELMGFTDTGLITPEMRRTLLSETDFEKTDVHTPKPIPTEHRLPIPPPGPVTASIREPKKGGRK
jgi:hypothetical protein